MNYSSELLNNVFEERKQRNSSYSMRAFARDLGIGKTTVSEVLSGRRKLSKTNLHKVILNLDLNSDQKKLIDMELGVKNIEAAEVQKIILNEEKLELIAHWHYLAILNLAKIELNRATAEWVSDRLGISVSIANEAIARLVKLELLKIKEGRLVRTSNPIHSSEDIPSNALKKHHNGMLSQAQKSLFYDDPEVREISTVTMAVAKKDFSKAKNLLRKFRQKFMENLSTEQPDEVYALGIHFYPLSRNKYDCHDRSKNPQIEKKVIQ